MAERPLAGGRSTPGVVRVGDTVRRPVPIGATFGRDCLLHLESVGFEHAPRFLGIDAAGRDVLSFVPGCVPADLGHYADVRIGAAAALLRRFHDATAAMPAVVASGCETVCHNDWSPTNTVFAAGEPAAMIDFDTAWPGDRLWDAGYSAFTWLDLGNDAYTGDEQIRRLHVFAEGYDRDGCTAARLAIYALARQTVLGASADARGQQPLATWAADCARWTALHVTSRLAPAGYSREG